MTTFLNKSLSIAVFTIFSLCTPLCSMGKEEVVDNLDYEFEGITSMDFVGNLTDAELERHVSRSPFLEEISLTCCFNITNAGLNTVTIRCPLIRTITLNDCPNITTADIAEIQEQNPLCQIIR